MELTGRQQEIWDFLVGYVDRHGYPPTVREIGSAVGLASPSTVHAHLANLERAGLLRRDPTKPRALELFGHRSETAVAAAPAPADVHRLPLLGVLGILDGGTITAGRAWSASPVMLATLHAPLGTKSAQFVFTPADSSGSWRIDDLYVDPWVNV